MEIKNKIFDFISTHEAIVSNDMRNKDENINVRFTTFGNRAGCNALYDIISLLDDNAKSKVIAFMDNKRVMD